jgi:DNA-binding NtrC family response regulator
MNILSETLPLWGRRALVVEPDQTDRELLVATLTSAGLIVTAADSFSRAHTRLVRLPPTVLITEIRLGYHNGLHLAHIARWLRRQMILVVTSHHRDPVLTRDAAALGATFVQKPLRPGRLLLTLYRASRAALPEQYAGA